MTTTNERIKKLRKTLDLTQQEFAERLGIRQNTVAKYETCRGTPTRSVVSLICREFHVNEEWLRTGDGEMFQPGPADDLDRLVTEYGLPQEFRALAEEFLDLKPSEQQVVVSFIRKLSAKLASESAAGQDDDDAAFDAECRAKAEAYYRELKQDREQTDGRSVFRSFESGDLLA